MNLLEPLKRLLRVATRSVEEERGYVILPYRGYGTRAEIFMIGRIFYQRTSGSKTHGTGNLLVQIARRLFRRGVAGVDVELRLEGSSQRVITDDDGYFRAHMPLQQPPAEDRLWHNVVVEILNPEADTGRRAVNGEVFIPPNTARFVVISDVDDTVMHTGVANKIKMFWRLFAQDAESRVAFPGVASLYNALLNGPSGNEYNPILYVSRGPWGIYDMLDAFFKAHNIPIGPILFLREWNVTLRSPLPRRAEDHKQDLIRKMLDLYHELPFVLIGDSGQHDPEIYAEIVHENPGRVLAVYIREVSGSSSRADELEKLTAEILKSGSSLVVADDSYVMARHAAEHGLISEAALAKVLEEKMVDAEGSHESKTPPVVVEG